MLAVSFGAVANRCDYAANAAESIMDARQYGVAKADVLQVVYKQGGPDQAHTLVLVEQAYNAKLEDTQKKKKYAILLFKLEEQNYCLRNQFIE